MFRPTARLRFEIDPDELNDELVVDLKRCFLNVAPMHVGERPEIKRDQPGRNTLGLIVVLHKPYWDDSVEGARDNWDDVVLPWLKNKLYKLNATVQNFNRTRAESGQPVEYGQLEIIMDNRVVAIRLPEGSAFPEQTLDLLDGVRAFANEGVLVCDDMLRVEIPWYDPSEEVLTGEGACDDGSLAEPGCCEGAAEAGSEDGCGDQKAAGAEGQPDCQPDGQPEEAAPAIDYTVWGVRSADGSVRRFDSVAGAWLE